MAVIMMGQCSVVCGESPRGVSACVRYLVNGKDQCSEGIWEGNLHWVFNGSSEFCEHG